MSDLQSPILSEAEHRLVHDPSIFYLKASITQKIIQQLNKTKAAIQTTALHQNFPYPIEMDIQLGKIAKGENYEGLPYLMLDFPRLFKPSTVFAFRTFFWWGKYCLCILHLSGDTLAQFKSKLRKSYVHFSNQNTYISCGKNEWHHALDKEHYQSIDELSEAAYQTLIDNQSFIKLVQQLPLNQLEQLPNFGKNAFELFVKALR